MIVKPSKIFGTNILASAIVFSALLVSAASDDGSDLPADKSVSLAASVSTFNRRAADDPIGKSQPVLTEDAVIAAIRWAMLDRNTLLVNDETFRTLKDIIANHTLPTGFDLEYLTGFEPNDEVAFEKWSVRLRIPASPYGTTCIMIQETMIGSRVIGDEERKVIHAWQKKVQEQGIGSMERAGYSRDRAAAAAIDSANDK
jgi:hypothetical protein